MHKELRIILDGKVASAFVRAPQPATIGSLVNPGWTKHNPSMKAQHDGRIWATENLLCKRQPITETTLCLGIQGHCMHALMSPQAPTWGMCAMNLNIHFAGSQGFNTSAFSTTAGTAAAGMGCAVRQWTRLVAQHGAPRSPVRAGAALQPLTQAHTLHGNRRTTTTPLRLASPTPLSWSSAAVGVWGTRPALWAHPPATRTFMTVIAGGTVDSMSSGSTSTVRSVLGGGGGDLSKGKGVDLSSLHGRHVAVVGGGVIGLATAMRALQ